MFAKPNSVEDKPAIWPVPYALISGRHGAWTCTLTKDVQPADDPSDNGTMPGRAELRGRGVEPAAGREGAHNLCDTRTYGRTRCCVSSTF